MGRSWRRRRREDPMAWIKPSTAGRRRRPPLAGVFSGDGGARAGASRGDGGTQRRSWKLRRSSRSVPEVRRCVAREGVTLPVPASTATTALGHAEAGRHCSGSGGTVVFVGMRGSFRRPWRVMAGQVRRGRGLADGGLSATTTAATGLRQQNGLLGPTEARGRGEGGGERRGREPRRWPRGQKLHPRVNPPPAEGRRPARRRGDPPDTTQDDLDATDLLRMKEKVRGNDYLSWMSSPVAGRSTSDCVLRRRKLGVSGGANGSGRCSGFVGEKHVEGCWLGCGERRGWSGRCWSGMAGSCEGWLFGFG